MLSKWRVLLLQRPLQAGSTNFPPNNFPTHSLSHFQSFRQVFERHVKINPFPRTDSTWPKLPEFLQFQQYAATRYATFLLALLGGSGSHLGLGRDADRRKKTGCRRRIVIKEDLDAEDRKRMAVSGELLCRAQHRLSHTYTVTCISLSSPPTLSGLTCIYPWTGVVRDILGSPILKFPQEPAVYFNFSLVEMPTEERRLVEEEGSQTKKTWLQKRED